MIMACYLLPNHKWSSIYSLFLLFRNIEELAILAAKGAFQSRVLFDQASQLDWFLHLLTSRETSYLRCPQ